MHGIPRALLSQFLYVCDKIAGGIGAVPDAFDIALRIIRRCIDHAEAELLIEMKGCIVP